MSGRTIASERVLEADHNSFGALRLLFAAFVIVSHSWTLGGHGPEPFVRASGGITLGYLGVCCFFALSGALVGRSAARTPPGRFLWQRARRVLPGYWACLPITAFGFGALVAHLQDLPIARALSTPDNASAASYVVNNFPLRIGQFGVGYALSKLPFSGALNGSLWSLPCEFLCYLAILLVVPGWLRGGVRSSSPGSPSWPSAWPWPPARTRRKSSSSSGCSACSSSRT
jgi:peptidoglycan/LPS O-acetylase OafA/YrhL